MVSEFPNSDDIVIWCLLFHSNLAVIITGNYSISTMSNWNSFFDHKKCGQPHTQPPVFSIFRGNTNPSTSYLSYFTGLFRPLLSGLNSLAHHFNHDLISTQDYHALLTQCICSLILSFVLTKALFVLVYISTSEPSLASSDNLSLHRFFFPYDLPSFLKSQKRDVPGSSPRITYLGIFSPSSLDLNQLLNIFNFTFLPDLDPDSISGDLFISFLNVSHASDLQSGVSLYR